MALTNVEEAFVADLGKVLISEIELLEGLPELAVAAEREDIQGLLESKIGTIADHIDRLEIIFRRFNRRPRSMSAIKENRFTSLAASTRSQSKRCQRRDQVLLNAILGLIDNDVSTYENLSRDAKLLAFDDAYEQLLGLLAEKKALLENLAGLELESTTPKAKS
jgi:ferritin-like metal-binding protein YciE